MEASEMLAKIRKLLAMAEDPAATAPEAEAFTAKAAELIAKYGIDQALLAEAQPHMDAVGDRVLVMDAPYARDKIHLLYTVATAMRCKGVYHTRWANGGRQLSMHLFGFGADLDRVELLFTSLLVQASHALAGERVPMFENPAAYRRSWYQGYSSAIGRRLRHAEARAAQQASPTSTGKSMELVLVDRTALVADAFANAYPKLGRGRARQLSGTGRGNGYAAGQRADLGGTRLAGGNSRALSGRHA
jgi:hypothetical protein